MADGSEATAPDDPSRTSGNRFSSPAMVSALGQAGAVVPLPHGYTNITRWLPTGEVEKRYQGVHLGPDFQLAGSDRP